MATAHGEPGHIAGRYQQYRPRRDLNARNNQRIKGHRTSFAPETASSNRNERARLVTKMQENRIFLDSADAREDRLFR